MFNRGRPKTLGFTLIELAIVLGITGLLFTGLWRLLSNGNQQLRDQATASQQQQLITAVSIYLASAHGQNWMGSQASQTFPLPLPPSLNPAGTGVATPTPTQCFLAMKPLSTPTGLLEDLCTILPLGFSGAEGWTTAQSPSPTVNPYGQSYYVHVYKDSTPQGTPPQSYSFMIVTSGGDTISDTDGGRISSMIGGDGGFLYNSNVCSASNTKVACGSYGAWSQDISATAYGFPAAQQASGHVASRTYYSQNQSSLNPWLARQNWPPADTTYNFNTMAWDMFVGNNAGVPYNINMAAPNSGATATAPGGNINMGGVSSTSVPGTIETPLTTNGGSINMASGTINMTGLPANPSVGPTINVDGGTINMNATGLTTGGGNINMQGGEITGTYTTNGLIGINLTGVATSPNLINLSIAGKGTNSAGPAINILTGCTQDQNASLKFPILTYDPPNAGTGYLGCTPGLQVQGDANVLGLLSADSLYSSTFIYQSSDLRLKTNIAPIRNALLDIMKLKPVSFTFKSSGAPSLGVIAQDVEKIYPQLVTERNGMKAVNYEGLIAPLIEAVQQLERENEKLKTQLEQQKVKQNELERKLDNR